MTLEISEIHVTSVDEKFRQGGGGGDFFDKILPLPLVSALSGLKRAFFCPQF